MVYHKYLQALIWRVTILLVSLVATAWAISITKASLIIIFGLTSIYFIYQLYRFTTKRFLEMDAFFDSVKYRDFTRWFAEQTGTEDIDQLHKGFNQVQKTIQDVNSEKESQFIIRQKILELIHAGIITYYVDTGKIIWMNQSFQKIIDIPTITDVGFIKKRKPTIYKHLFESSHRKENTITLEINSQRQKVLVSSAAFVLEERKIKLLIVQNIDQALNQNESEAWKKLLSVMTHEIMNSIAPISSLAETLQSKIALSMEDQDQFPLETEDLHAGIQSIQKRSEGLYKFAQIYRSLNNVTELNLTKTSITKLFDNIHHLMAASLKNKGVSFETNVETPNLTAEMDAYLIEQVLINLILNASAACKDRLDSKIILRAVNDLEAEVTIQVIDNGSGISEEIMESIFIPFFTTKKKGSGIGLSLSKQIMLLHNGRIQIASKEGVGTTVNLIFG